ncbi:hypothetical protein [Chryseobacterium sp. SIMBA_028]|uniref:hypothetical protein n=1 Tax=Chryseobacterium sp. SIMBA_028 TaxID=3085771 RepID=UPI00397804EC
MAIQYRNNHFKIVPEKEVEPRFSGYKDHIMNDTLKIREKHIAGYLFAIHYYKDLNENDEQIVEQFRSTPDLEMLSIRVRQVHGDFRIDHVKYFDFDENRFSPLTVRELYNNKEQMISCESTDSLLPLDGENYYDLVKYYFATEKGMEGQFFSSHYNSGIFTDIEYFPQGLETDDQDVERGFYGIYAEELMRKMNIPSKMMIWYMNNEFLPEL